MKIQTKTTILFTLLTGAFFIAFEFIVYYFISKAANNDFHKRLELRARISSKFRFEQDHVSTEGFMQLQKEYLEKLNEEKAFVFQHKTDSNLFSPEPNSEIPQKYLNDIVTANGNTVFQQKKFRHYAGLLYHDETGDFIVIKSATNAYGEDLMTKLRNIMLVTLLGSVVVIFAIGSLFSKRTFRPFRSINKKVKQINRNNLHLRLEETDGSDEIAELTRTFNKMIDRIEVAFESQNNFISNASHELRTPLTAIIGEADYALSKDRSVEDYKHSMMQVAGQAGRLQHLIKGLLDLAQTGFDGKKLTWVNIRLDELVFEVKESVDAIMPGNDIIICLGQLPDDESKLYCTGTKDILKVAISNIVVNACKYSNNQRVEMHLRFDNAHGIITIKDKGIGIPAEELKYIYDPFFRASNTNEYEGYGIGMPLSFNIIRLHKGKLHVYSKEGEGTTVEIKLPLTNQ
ncbi:MAG: HAMP domain-containing histidine kinase [Sphingobacteriales bacterium]|nr:MAG: HAMP domain-containing histidine kinase [Sphingobacteriales bacterium]